VDILASCFETAKRRHGRVVLPEGNDARIVAAARRLADESIAQPIILGKPDKVEAAAVEAGVTLAGIETVNPADSEQIARYSEAYRAGRSA
jgi:phosphotransacetylase